MYLLKYDRKLTPNGRGYYYMNMPKAVAEAWPKNVDLLVIEDHIEIWPKRIR